MKARHLSTQIALSVIVPQRLSDTIRFDAPERRSRYPAPLRTPTGRGIFMMGRPFPGTSHFEPGFTAWPEVH
jgi:hypothetical protein